MDRSNAAITKFTEIPPAVLEAITKDPAQMQPWVRSLLALHIDEVDTMLAENPAAMTIPQRLQWIEFLAKLGDAMPKPAQSAAQGGGGGFGVTIVLNQTQGKPPSPPAVVIEND
jgi:hypothetical protein